MLAAGEDEIVSRHDLMETSVAHGHRSERCPDNAPAMALIAAAVCSTQLEESWAQVAHVQRA